MKLRDFIQAVRKRKDWTQRDMAVAIGTGYQDVQRMESAGRNLEKQFSIFIKLLPLLEEFGVIPARERTTLTSKEIINDAIRNGKKISGPSLRGKKGVEKGSVSHLPTRGDPGKGAHGE